MPNFSENSFNFTYLFKNILKQWYFYVIGAFLVIMVISSLFLLRKKGERNNLTKTQKLVYTAIMSALCFVVNCFTIPMGNVLQISLIATVGFVSGYILGAGLGFTSAFIGDLICSIIFPTGPYSPIINVGTALWGYVPGVIFTVFPGNDFIKAGCSFVICFILNSFAVNTLGLSLMYSIPFTKLLITLPVKLAVVAINAVISTALMTVLKRVLPKDKFNLNSEKVIKDELPVE